MLTGAPDVGMCFIRVGLEVAGQSVVGNTGNGITVLEVSVNPLQLIQSRVEF